MVVESATRRRVVVGPGATLGLVLDELAAAPPDDIVAFVSVTDAEANTIKKQIIINF